MGKQVHKSTMFLLLVFGLTSCSSGTVQNVEVTRLIPQTVEVTRIIAQTAMMIPTTQETVESTPKPAKETSTGVQAEPDASYYLGIVVIAKYYALVEQGLYEEAYKLLSPNRPHAESLEEYVVNRNMFKLKKAKIITIRPSYESEYQLRYRTTPDPLNKRMYYMEIDEEGENGMAGANMNGIHDYFVTVLLEHGEWKLYSVNTSP